MEAEIVPLEIYCARARDRGQKEARLSESGREIAPFEMTPSPLTVE